MRTTLRKRTFSSPNTWNRSQSPKRRKLNPDHDNNVSLSFDTSQLQSLHQQLMALKNKHGLDKNNRNDEESKPKQEVKQTEQNQNKCNTKINKQHNKIKKHKSEQKQSVKSTKHKSEQKKPVKSTRHNHKQCNKSNKSNKKPKPKTKRSSSQNAKKNKGQSTDVDINNFLEIDEHQNNHPSDHNLSDDNDEEEWSSFINSADFKSKKKQFVHKKRESVRETPNKASLVDTATATENDWNSFLDTRYDENHERAKDWIEPEIHTFWERGPIGLISNWWNDDTLIKFEDNEDDDTQQKATNNIELSAEEISKKKQNKLIKIDIMKELKQQRLEKRLRDRMQTGELVKNMDDDTFESFFTSAFEMGQNIREKGIEILQKKENDKKKVKKTKIFQPKLKKIKTIATFENDDLFFIDTEQSDEERDSDKINGEMMQNINENDMIYVNQDSINNKNVNPAVVAKALSEQILLKQRVEMQHKEIVESNVNDDNDTNDNRKNRNSVLPVNILSNTVEDSLKEKKILKKLNVMDFVNNYKDAFFRDVEELNLNVSALVDNWQVIKKNDGLSRKLKKKLGIIMARERQRRAKAAKKEHKMKQMIQEMINESESEEMENHSSEDSGDTDTDTDTDLNIDSEHVESDNDSRMECFLNE